MTAMLLALLLPGQVVSGTATYYHPGVFHAVAANRGMMLSDVCRECVGYVSLLDCDDIGRRVCVSNGTEWVGPLLNVDCAAGVHREHLERTGWVADLPYWLAERWDMSGPITATVATCRAPLRGEIE